jgi:hypothetical protein
MDMNSRKKTGYKRMSKEDFNALCAVLFDDKNRPIVSFTKLGKSYEHNAWNSDI